MTERTLTHLVAVVDRSGSMSAIRSDMQEGFDKLINDQRRVPGTCKVTLILFDDQYEVAYTDRDVTIVPPLDLEPRGMTALLDAIGRTIVSTGEKLRALPEHQRPGLVTFLIITDGLENHSTEYQPPEGLARIHEMIKQQREQWQWQFIFLGAKQDALATGAALGTRRGSTMTYAPTHAGTRSVYASTSEMVTNTRTGVARGMSAGDAAAAAEFTDEDREKALDTDKAKK